MTLSLAFVCALALFPLRSAQDSVPEQALSTLQTRAERSQFAETSRLADVEVFLRELGALSPLLRTQTFGQSEEGRPLWLASLSDPPVSNGREAHGLERPIVFVQANIHAGEVEGKEAVQNLLRRLALGDLRELCKEVVVLVAPVYNVDGNEDIDPRYRTEQYGPIGGVGRRENAHGLDLNRDYMKLDSAEARALVACFNAWDPHVVVDLHTTNGTYHGYHLTYSVPLNLSFEPDLIDFQRLQMMPALAKAMEEKHSFRTYYYGNIAGKVPQPGETDTRVWEAFDYRPRLGQNYVGLRNRIAILSEAYSYLDFETRIAVTEAFVEEILHFAATHGERVRELCQTLDRNFVRRALAGEEILLGVEYRPRRSTSPVPILLAEVEQILHPSTQKPMTAVLAKPPTVIHVYELGEFEPVRSVAMAQAYTLPRSEELGLIVDRLVAHGLLVEELLAPQSVLHRQFVVEEIERAARPFQGHNTVRLKGRFADAPMTLPEGTLIVRLAQPLGRLAAYLLEPESDDGLVTWNFFDEHIAAGSAFPVGKVMGPAALALRRFEGF